MVAAQEFDQIRNGNENIIWAGRPAHLPFVASGIPFLIFGLLWGSFDLFLFILPMSLGAHKGFGGFGLIAVPFFALHLLPFWASVLNMFRLYYVYYNAAYALTDKRMIIRGGFWGASYESIDFDQIVDLQVSVGPLEKLFGVGSVRANSGRVTSKGTPILHSFTAIQDPYDVYKEVKRVSLDIKSDLEYPNKLRPTDNPGYNTAYTGK
jgi:hypothetical protein